MVRACLWQQQKTPTYDKQRQAPSFVSIILRDENARSGSDSRLGTGFLTLIQCLDDDDIAFSLWRVLLRKCINTLWYGWFTLFFGFLLLLAIFYTFLLFSYYIEIFEAGETGQWSLPFYMVFFSLCTSPAFVSECFCCSPVICFGRKALWSWRVYSFCLYRV